MQAFLGYWMREGAGDDIKQAHVAAHALTTTGRPSTQAVAAHRVSHPHLAWTLSTMTLHSLAALQALLQNVHWCI